MYYSYRCSPVADSVGVEPTPGSSPARALAVLPLGRLGSYPERRAEYSKPIPHSTCSFQGCPCHLAGLLSKLGPLNPQPRALLLRSHYSAPREGSLVHTPAESRAHDAHALRHVRFSKPPRQPCRFTLQVPSAVGWLHASLPDQATPGATPGTCLRRRGDSNPWHVAVHTLSRRAP